MPDPPTADEIADAEETQDELPGIAYFHDSWRIVDTSVDEAGAYLHEERQLADLVASMARDEEHFDQLISVVEGGWVSDPSEDLTPGERETLGSLVWDVPPDLASLELGVAGLSYALNAVGFVTASSCRGHFGSGAWSRVPVVAFAAPRSLARLLQELASTSGCTFFIDEVRPQLLVVAGRSIKNTMDLAERIIDSPETFAEATGVPSV